MEGNQGEPTPTIAPTRPSTLMLGALLAAVVGWWVINRFYGELPPLPWLPAATLLVLAVIEAIAARTTKSRIDRKPGTEPVEPLVVARLAVLAKASSLAGAVLGGAYLGVLIWVFSQRDRLAAAANDVVPAGIGVLASVALVAAALWLESACRIPDRPDDNSDSQQA